MRGEARGLFFSLVCFYCWWVGGGGVEQIILFGVWQNHILRVPDSIQGWGKQCECKISYFCF